MCKEAQTRELDKIIKRHKIIDIDPPPENLIGCCLKRYQKLTATIPDIKFFVCNTCGKSIDIEKVTQE